MLIDQPGEDEVECQFSYDPQQTTHTHITQTACATANSLRGGTATVEMLLLGAGTPETVATASLTVTCPDTMTPTGTDGYCECPLGYYADGTVCIPCGVGYYSLTIGLINQQACLECPGLKGAERGLSTTIMDNATTLEQCVCNPSLIMTDETARTCECPAGTYLVQEEAGSGENDVASCESCPENTLQPVIALSVECTSCITTMQDANVFTSGITGATDANQCVCVDTKMEQVTNGTTTHCLCKVSGRGAKRAVRRRNTGEGIPAKEDRRRKSCRRNRMASGVLRECKADTAFSSTPPLPFALVLASPLSRSRPCAVGPCSRSPALSTRVPCAHWCVCVCVWPVLNFASLAQPGYYYIQGEGMDAYGSCVQCDVGKYKSGSNLQAACSDCTNVDPNTSSQLGATSSSGCVCSDANMLLMDDGKCGCRAGYSNDNPSTCSICKFGFYSETTNTDPDCSHCGFTVSWRETTSVRTHV